MATLDQLRVGQAGRVESMAGDPALVQRLYEIGLVEGELVEVVGFAPLGDPVELRIGNTCLSLRNREAAIVFVTIDDVNIG